MQKLLAEQTIKNLTKEAQYKAELKQGLARKRFIAKKLSDARAAGKPITAYDAIAAWDNKDNIEKEPST